MQALSGQRKQSIKTTCDWAADLGWRSQPPKAVPTGFVATAEPKRASPPSQSQTFSQQQRKEKEGPRALAYAFTSTHGNQKKKEVVAVCLGASPSVFHPFLCIHVHIFCLPQESMNSRRRVSLGAWFNHAPPTRVVGGLSVCLPARSLATH